jgi:hypothetical protein
MLPQPLDFQLSESEDPTQSDESVHR